MKMLLRLGEQVIKNQGCEVIIRTPLMICLILYGGLYGAILGIPLYSLWLLLRLKMRDTSSVPKWSQSILHPMKWLLFFSVFSIILGMIVSLSLNNYWISIIYFNKINYFVLLISFFVVLDTIVRLIAVSMQAERTKNWQQLFISEILAWTASLSIFTAFTTVEILF